MATWGSDVRDISNIKPDMIKRKPALVCECGSDTFREYYNAWDLVIG